MNLKLRLNLIITGLLLIILLVGMALNVINARKNVRAEVESTERLTLYLFDTGILNNPEVVSRNMRDKPFHLQRLKHMRHLRVSFFDTMGNQVDSNVADDLPVLTKVAPVWFERMMAWVTPAWQSQQRPIEYQGQLLGHLEITPDPSYEYAEVWKQMTDLFLLLAVFFVTVNLMVFWAVGQALKPTDRISEALNSLEQGNLDTRLPVFELPELARISLQFNHMIETLEQSIQRNHRLTQQLITLQEEERKSLARDLHDEFGQCLTAIHADSTAVLRIAENKYPELIPSADAIALLSRHLMEMVSGLLQRLRPGVLDELGLPLAIRDLVETWQSRYPGVKCQLSLDAMIPTEMEEVLQVTAYRMVQECLTNISRHADATEVAVVLTLEPVNGVLHISVSDNGKGFQQDTAGGFGLPGMRERVEGLGGLLVINTQTSSGTTVRARIPLNGVKKDELASG